MSSSPGRLESRSIIITGSASGIGSGFAEGFAASGARVAVVDRSAEAAEAVASRIRRSGGIAQAFAADVTDRAGLRQAFRAAREAFDGLDAVFNNAGLSLNKPFLDTTADDMRRLHEVNVLGVLNGMQEAAAIYIEDGVGGKIVNTCSIASRKANANFASYAASKFAVHALVQSGARALAEHHITVNGFAPGIVDTALWNAQVSSQEEREALFERYGETILAGRVATPADLLPTGIFLAGPDSDYMTGQIIMIDGGIELV